MERLRFDYGKWDLNVAGRATVPNGALVLESREHRDIVQASEELARICAKARQDLARDPEAAVALGTPRAIAEAAATDPAAQPIVTRIDFFLTRNGWQVSESNDDCPGGYNEAIGLPAVLGDAVPARLEIPGDLPAALCGLLPRHGRIALLYATGYAEDMQAVQLVSRILQAQGVETILASPAHLECEAGRPPTVLGESVAGIFRFFPGEWLPGLPNWQAWRRLVASGFPLANPLSATCTQSKAMHAWLQTRHGDEACVSQLLPETHVLDNANAQRALAAPHDWVLKPSFGRMGEGVIVGATCPPPTWQKRVAAALRAHRTRPYVVQRKFDAVPVETEPGVPWTVCVGAYVVAGRFAGYYSRMARGPVVAYDAANVLTVVETP